MPSPRPVGAVLTSCHENMIKGEVAHPAARGKSGMHEKEGKEQNNPTVGLGNTTRQEPATDVLLNILVQPVSGLH